MCKYRYVYFFILVFLFGFLGADSIETEKSTLLLNKYLAGSARYCEKLKSEAYHFYCKEKILLEKDDFIYGRLIKGKLTRRISKKNYLFDYQIIQKRGKLQERRRLIADKVAKKESDPYTLNLLFLSEKAVFGPNSILDKERQSNFNFKLLEYKKTGENDLVVIEAIPKKPGKIFFLSAEIYIDTTDFSVRKIVGPVYVSGYKSMKRIAASYKSRLSLVCEIRFNHEYKGLFFPTFIYISEKYIGGSMIYRNVGPRGWERSKTIFTYSDYKFFEVGTEVKIQD